MNVVGLLGLAALHSLAADDDAALGEIGFLPNLGHDVPLVVMGTTQRGSDELGPNIRFGE
jgi:hypothetical protein